MITPIVEVSYAAVIVVALLVSVIRGLSLCGVPPASRRLIALGLSLVLLGGFQYSSRHFLPSGYNPIPTSSYVNLWLYEVLLLCGAVFLTIGLILLGKVAIDIARRRKLEAVLMCTPALTDEHVDHLGEQAII